MLLCFICNVAHAYRPLALSLAKAFELVFASVGDVVPDQIGLIWLQVRAMVLVPVARAAVILCLIMSVILFIEKFSMGLVSFYVKVFRRKPENIYKWEPVREDEELGTLAYPMVLVQIPMYNEREVICHLWL